MTNFQIIAVILCSIDHVTNKRYNFRPGHIIRYILNLLSHMTVFQILTVTLGCFLGHVTILQIANYILGFPKSLDNLSYFECNFFKGHVTNFQFKPLF